MRKFYVIAGRAREADDWAREHGLKHDDYVYVHDAYRLRSTQNGFRFVCVGSWERRKDIHEIDTILAARKAEKYDPDDLKPWHR